MLKNLPKIKGLPDDLAKKLEKRKEKFNNASEEHSKAKIDYLATKLKAELLLDLSLSAEDKDLSASLVVSKQKWTRQIQAVLLNNASIEEEFSEEIVKSLKTLMLESLKETSTNLLSHWQASDASQLPILIQTDQDLLKEMSQNGDVDFKQLKDESRWKEIIQNHSKVTQNLIQNHALGHVSTLDKLQINYLASKKRLDFVIFLTF